MTLWIWIAELGPLPDRGRVSGGGARSEEWLRIVTGGLWGSPAEAAEAAVAPTSTVEPVADWIEPYRERREEFRALYPAIRDAVRSPGSSG